MQAIAKLKEQHLELLELVQEISLYLETDKLLSNAKKVRGLLSKLAARIDAHHVAEDRLIYPYLMNNERREVSEMASLFKDEMGGLLDFFFQYNEKWGHHESISEDPESFISDTNVITDALGTRIDREDSELFVLLD
jgi:hypothetical protein